MSDIDDGGQAFPSDSDNHGFVGMTLRDYFAARVIERFIQDWPPPQAAARAYDVADAMIAARKIEKS